MRGQGVAEKCPSCLEAPYLGGFPELGVPVPKDKDYCILGSTLGSPPFRATAISRNLQVTSGRAGGKHCQGFGDVAPRSGADDG